MKCKRRWSSIIRAFNKLYHKKVEIISTYLTHTYRRMFYSTLSKWLSINHSDNQSGRIRIIVIVISFHHPWKKQMLKSITVIDIYRSQPCLLLHHCPTSLYCKPNLRLTSSLFQIVSYNLYFHITQNTITSLLQYKCTCIYTLFFHHFFSCSNVPSV